MNLRVLMLLGACMVSTQVLSSMAYPDSFADYFAAQDEKINVVIAGDLKGAIINATVNYESLTLLPDSQATLSHYLEQQLIKQAAITEIISTLKGGIEANPGCVSSYEECVVSPGDDGVSYLFDLENSLLKIFISPNLIDAGSSHTEYYSPVKHNLALINQTDLYIDSDFKSNPTLTFSNESILGLPVGYIFADTQYSGDSGDFDVYSAYYDVEYGPHKVRVGKGDGSSMSFNTTEFLSNDANYDSIGVFWGSSHNLAKVQGGNMQKIFYFAPQNGLLEVYKGERLLFTKNVAQGRQSILYSDLPSGAYNITIKLKVGSQVAFEETRQVINNQNFMLSKGEFDFYASAAQFDTDDNDLKSILEHNVYVRGSVSNRLLDSLLLAGSITGTRDTAYMQLGGQYFYDDVLSLTSYGGIFSSGEQYTSAQLMISPFSFSWSKFERDNASSANLSSQLYGESSYDKSSIGLSGALLGGFAYLSYNRYSYESQVSLYSSDTVSGSWTHEFLGGMFSVNANYDRQHSNQNPDQYSIGLSWSRPLTDNLSTSISAYSNQDGFDRVTSTINANLQYHDWLLSANVGSTLNRNNDALFDASFSANGANRYVNTQLYGFTNNSGDSSFSASLSNTQIYSRSGVYLTDKNANTYINIETVGPHTGDERIFYNISSNGGRASRERLLEKSTYIATSDYQYAQVILDAESSDLELEHDRAQFFIQPGAIYSLETEVYPLESDIYLLSDIDQKPVKTLRCKGKGCVSVEPLSNDGVFRVNYRVGQKFELFSAKNLCISPWAQEKKKFTSGFCLPGISNEDSLIAYQRNDTQEDVRKVLFYLGRFDDKEAAKRILDKLEQANIEVKAIEVDPDLYVYAKDPGELTVVQKDLLQSLNAYVLNDSEDTELAASRGIDYDF